VASAGVEWLAPPRLGAEPADHLQGVYILLLEGHALVRDALVECLRSYGAIVEASASLQGLRDTLDDVQMRPDLLLLDMSLLHDEAHFDALREAAATPDQEPAFMFMLDGAARASWLPETAAVISKPFMSRDLVNRIKRLTSGVTDGPVSVR
jgi:DNA-binding response OmpR family regulator